MYATSSKMAHDNDIYNAFEMLLLIVSSFSVKFQLNNNFVESERNYF